ncbi:hypothetical protein LNKW23_33990 [Paralimibaculum aggregatum]|uniref:Uncharacterized protein n=1 Tax=Paralimibaculum aggregatum TaxID=3036245 RepID=A0ABQ6LPE5_9RHOB|nr:hypothetical protein [Limibaculum sp. NKW23]GMG84185.1 hypothetical protein LNKW23_33990 [Limibaculum sp. NKW23]
MSRRWRWRVAGLLLVVAVSPWLSLIVLAPLAAIGDCTITEAGVNPCRILGRDIGAAMTHLGLFAAWGVLLTGPLALALAALWGAAELALWLLRRRGVIPPRSPRP